MESKYVDLTMRPAKFAPVFFGYIKKDALA